MDIHQTEIQILQLLALIIGSLVVWLLQRALAWLNIRLSSDRQTALESAVDKMMTLGVTAADTTIREKGWDHVDSKNAVIDAALPALQTKFAETLSRSGLDLSKPEDRIRLQTMMDRMWPDVAARLSASPATPPAPVAPAVIVAPPAAA